MIEEIPILALTPGEPAGIGPECFIRMAHAHPELRLLAVADREMLNSTAQTLDLDISFTDWNPGDPVVVGQPACFQHSLAAPVTTGKLNPVNASYVFKTIVSAVRLVHAGHAGAMVTGPVHKGVINDAGIKFSGHTELLAELAGVW